jgi:RimJ/RimL family protein N-acetyltransferase
LKILSGDEKMLTTKRLIIKSYTDDDEARMVELLTNDKIKEGFMIPDFSSREEAVRMFKKLQKISYSPEHYEYGIYLQDDLIGFVNDVEIEDGAIEIGYVIHPDYHNQGYATEMLTAVIQDLFQKGYHEVIAAAFESNPASFRVMEKSGMKRIKKTEEIFYHGQNHPCIFYSIKSDEK